MHTIPILSSADIDYILRTTLQFKVYGVIDHRGDGIFLGQKVLDILLKQNFLIFYRVKISISKKVILRLKKNVI